ncbi:hypothetical protein [Intestinirhabdus alba]|uniref:Uncharacterized protein n=1 Tax=Intestinirhabdus alba TaxID=2899544 RepID=A0A6L6IL59_9ENTR|nr:hypothetical protein [Intestinirhabdus alba]MTH45453.1 hypothetical protein [Intestinirhabdus alba]
MADVAGIALCAPDGRRLVAWFPTRYGSRAPPQRVGGNHQTAELYFRLRRASAVPTLAFGVKGSSSWSVAQ